MIFEIMSVTISWLTTQAFKVLKELSFARQGDQQPSSGEEGLELIQAEVSLASCRDGSACPGVYHTSTHSRRLSLLSRVPHKLPTLCCYLPARYFFCILL